DRATPRVASRPEPRLASARRGPLPPRAPATGARPQPALPARACAPRARRRPGRVRVDRLCRLGAERVVVRATRPRRRRLRARRMQLHAGGTSRLPGRGPVAGLLPRADQQCRGRVWRQQPRKRGWRMARAETVAGTAALARAHVAPSGGPGPEAVMTARPRRKEKCMNRSALRTVYAVGAVALSLMMVVSQPRPAAADPKGVIVVPALPV